MSKLNIEIVNIVNDIGVDVYQDINRVNVEVNQVGVAGSNGVGVPVGGDTGQVLAKKTATNYDTEWIDAAEISVPDATTLVKGIVQLAGDLTGTAEAPLVADGAITDIKVASGIDKAKVGLANVDNTSDINKPISTATQTALDLKANLASPTFTGTVTGIDKTMVGLANVDNTSDLDKPVSTATQSALDLKAPIDQPVFTGGVTSESYAITNYTGHRLLLDDGNLLEPNLVEETYFLSSTGDGDPLGNTPVWIDISNLYVPYTGATGNINLDIHTITASGVTVTALTVSKLVATDVANNLVSLATDTYPSLAEISYVKGVTSAIQTQINSKENTANKSTTTTLGTSNTLFPTQNAVKTYVDTQLSSKVSLTGAETLTNKRIVAGVNAQTGTNYTLVATDFSGWVTANNVLAQTYTLPQQSALATNNGDSTKIININNSFITLVTQGSDIIIGNTIIAPFQSIDIRRTTSTTWETFGGSATVNDGFIIPVIKAATANDVAYFTIFAPYAGTILSCSQLSDSLGTAGTYTVSINGVNVTGLTTITNTVSKTTTTATAVNTFAVGSVIKVTLSAAVATGVNMSFTLLTSKIQ